MSVFQVSVKLYTTWYEISEVDSIYYESNHKDNISLMQSWETSGIHLSLIPEVIIFWYTKIYQLLFYFCFFFF